MSVRGCGATLGETDMVEGAPQDDGKRYGRRGFVGRAVVLTGAAWAAPAVSTVAVASAGSAGGPGIYCASAVLTPTPGPVGGGLGTGALSVAASVNFGFGFSAINSVTFGVRVIRDDDPNALVPLILLNGTGLSWGSTFGPLYPSVTLPNSLISKFPDIDDAGLLAWTFFRVQTPNATIFEAQVCIDGTPA